jgi:TonB family protein
MAADCMNRLQKKCFVASAAFHLLLVVTLLVGSAFRPPVVQPGGPPVITMVKLPAQQEPLASAQPDAGNAAQPNPAAKVVPELKPPNPEREVAPTGTDYRPKLPRISMTPVFRPPGGKSGSKQPAAADPRLTAIDGALKTLGQGLSPSTRIEMGSSGGGDNGAEAYAQIVKDIYTRNWDPSGSNVTSEDAVTEVTVTIASDGKVLSARIKAPSSDAQADLSVQRTLERVTLISAFEPGAKEKQRTYTIHFNLRAKRLGN